MVTQFMVELIPLSGNESEETLLTEVGNGIFESNLLRLVQARLSELRNGLVSADQYLVPGARALLDSLSRDAISFYAAGT